MTNNNTAILKENKYLDLLLKIGNSFLYLFIFSIFLSKALGNIFAGLLITVTVIYLIATKFNIKMNNASKYGIVLFGTGFILNLIVGGGISTYLIKYYYLFLPLGLSIFIDSKKNNKLIDIFQISLLLNLIYGFIIYTKTNIRFAGAFHTGREGDILLMVILFNISMLVYFVNKDKKIYYLTFFNTIISGIALALTETRGSWLGLFAGMGAFVIISKNKKVIIAVLISLFILFMGDYFITNKIINRIKETTDTTTQGRLQIWNVAKGVVSENVLLGVGRSNVESKMKEYYYSQDKEFQLNNKEGIKFGRNVHNSFLQILIEYGILFLILFLIFPLIILIDMFKRINTKNQEQNAFAIAAIIILVGFYVSQIFHTELFSHGAYIFYLIIGMAYAYKEEETKKISLVISVYKNIEYLDLILRSVERQVYKNFEVIIAEDNNGKEMKEYIEEARKRFNFEIKHVSQEDIGFRKNKILNKAILEAYGEYIIFIDGDCVLHNMFIYQYVKNIKDNYVLFGRRTHVSKKISTKLVETKNLKLLSLPIILLTKGRRKEEAFYVPFITSNRKSGVYGCNFMVSKKDLYEVNGFDEEYEGPYFGEDNDIERRLRLKGTKFKCIKRKTIQYHLYHEKGDRQKDWEKNKNIYDRKTKEGNYFCKLGLKK